MKMKSLYSGGLTFIIITALTFSACKKSSTPKEDIVGTWTAGTTTFTATVGNQPLSQYFTTVLGLPAAQADQFNALFNATLQQNFVGTITVKSDNTYTSTFGGKTDSGTWALSADDKTLTVTSSTSAPVVFQVIQLTSSKLHVSTSETINQDLNGDGTPEVINVAIDLTLSK